MRIGATEMRCRNLKHIGDELRRTSDLNRLPHAV